MNRESRSFRSSFPDLTEAGFRTNAWAAGVPGADEALIPLHRTLIEALASAADLGGETGVTLVSEEDGETEEHRSFRTLANDAETFAVGLSRMGVKAGDRVVLVLPTSFEFIAAFFAVQRLGAIPAPSYPPAALERVETGIDRIAHICQHSEASYVVTTRALRTLLGELGSRVSSLRQMISVERLSETEASAADRGALPSTQSIDPDQIAFIQYTSGSTGHPKGVALTHKNVVANMHAAGQAGNIRRTDVFVSWLPLYHDMGLIGGLLWGIYWRIPVVLMSPIAFLMQPVRWLRAIQRHRATMTAAPNFAYALCVKRIRPRDRDGLDLSSCRLYLNGAEPVNANTLRDFTEAFGPFGFREEAFFPAYGLAESCVAVTFPPPSVKAIIESVDRAALADGYVESKEGEGSVSLVCVGKAVPGHEVTIVDERGDPLDYRDVGHIVVRGPSIMQGYYRNHEATSAVIRDGWLWTGDLGYLTKEGLFVTGRAKDLIIVRGKNFYAEDIETMIEGTEGVRPSGVVAFAVYDEEAARDHVVVICETKLTETDERTKLAEAICERASEGCGLAIDEVVFVEPGTIPKTSSGKRQRSLARQRYLQDALVPHKTGKLKLVQVFARSAAGLLTMLTRQMRGRREPP